MSYIRIQRNSRDNVVAPFVPTSRCHCTSASDRQVQYKTLNNSLHSSKITRTVFIGSSTMVV